jgi:SpoU rRNA methylase family enzyme
MPFSHVANSYQPEQLDKLTEAFNLVWPQVVLANGTATDIELERIRHRLANFIVACASRGEFEPEKLRETALAIIVREPIGRLHDDSLCAVCGQPL